MLVKGTLKGNILSTEMGDFHVVVHLNWPDELEGVFEIAKITADSYHHRVTVEGYETSVKIPIIKAEVLRVYTVSFEGGIKNDFLETEKGNTEGEDNSIDTTVSTEDAVESFNKHARANYPGWELKPNNTPSVILGSNKQESTQPDLLNEDLTSDSIKDVDEEVELFGKPLSDLGDTYQLDHSVGRDVIKRIFQFFQKKGVKLDAKTQSFDLRGLAA